MRTYDSVYRHQAYLKHIDKEKEYRKNHRLETILYLRKYAEEHKEELKVAQAKYRKEHPHRPHVRTPEQWRARNKTLRLKLPLATMCELCPEDDTRKATEHHHPDYAYPEIFVSCCNSCHQFVHKGVDVKVLEVRQ